jgi:hypothetical protein
MNLNLIALPGEATNIALTHIEGRIQVPHVPLRFNSETEDVQILAIIQDPRLYLESLSDITNPEKSLTEYIDFMKKAVKADYIYTDISIKSDTNAFILDLFDRLNLSEENYKTKTGSESLRDDVENKEITIVEHHVPNTNPLNPNDYNLEESWTIYNEAFAKAILI